MNKYLEYDDEKKEREREIKRNINNKPTRKKNVLYFIFHL
jgi:hypothetical protein